MTFILIVITAVYLGSTVTFQEFNSMQQCQYVAKEIQKVNDVRSVWCVNK
jgi:hypothetical protein